MVGKYVGLQDAYKSLNEALVHGGIANRVKVNVRWIDAELFEREDASDIAAHGWSRATRSWSPARSASAARRARSPVVKFAREKRHSVFRHLFRHADGLCRGRTRTRQGSRRASSTEFGATAEPVVGLITEWMGK